MPRPKSDLKLMSIKLSEGDRSLLAELASLHDPPNANEAIRIAIREAAERRLSGERTPRRVDRMSK